MFTRLLLLATVVVATRGQCAIKGIDDCEANIMECQWGGALGCVDQECTGLDEATCNMNSNCYYPGMCMPTMARMMCPAGTSCLEKNYCEEEADKTCAMIDVVAACSAQSSIIDCYWGRPCDWNSGSCVDFQCMFRTTETECNAKTGCNFANFQCQSVSSSCADKGLFECSQSTMCGVDISTNNNDCVECSLLDQTKCAATEFCEWSGSSCMRMACAAYTSETECRNNQCFWDYSYGRCTFGNDAKCDQLPVANCTQSVGCMVSGSTCAYKDLPATSCGTLDRMTCDYYVNCSYSIRDTACVAAPRCDNDLLCTGDCKKVAGECVAVTDGADTLCETFKLQGQCDPNDKCVWTNNQCRFMIGCHANTEADCIRKSMCSWNSTFDQCSRQGSPACSSVDFRTACSGGRCDGINPVFMNYPIETGNFFIDGAYMVEINPQTVIINQGRGIACGGTGCDICAPGYVTSLDVKVSCATEGGQATLTPLVSGGMPCTYVLGGAPVVPPDTVAPTAVPGAPATMSPSVSATLAPTATPGATTTPGTTEAPGATQTPGAATATPVPGTTSAPGVATATPAPGTPPTDIPGSVTATPIPGAATATPIPGTTSSPGAATATPAPGTPPTDIPGSATATPIPGAATATPIPGTPTPQTESPDVNTDDDGLPVYAIVLIVVGSLVVLGGITALVFFKMGSGAAGGKVSFQDSLVQDTEMGAGHQADAYKPMNQGGAQINRL